MNTYNIKPLNIMILFSSIKNLYGNKLAEKKKKLPYWMYIIYNQKELLAVLISEYLHKLYIFFSPSPLQNNLK